MTAKSPKRSDKTRVYCLAFLNQQRSVWDINWTGPSVNNLKFSHLKRSLIQGVDIMIKLFSLKQQKKDEVPGRAGNQKKASAAQLRITKGLLINSP